MKPDNDEKEKRPLMDKLFGPITPEDELEYPRNPRNWAVEKLGLPDDWRMSNADEKRWAEELPMNMGMGAVGSVRKVGPALMEAAAAKAYPELAQYAGQMARNSKAPISLSGPVNSSFQKLRDFMGHTGPVILKSK